MELPNYEKELYKTFNKIKRIYNSKKNTTQERNNMELPVQNYEIHLYA